MQCKECGSWVADDASFCPICGSPLPWLDDPFERADAGASFPTDPWSESDTSAHAGVEGNLMGTGPNGTELVQDRPQSPIPVGIPVAAQPSAPLASSNPAPSNSPKPSPHPYHQLGGWLKAIVVAGYALFALTVLSLCIGAFFAYRATIGPAYTAEKTLIVLVGVGTGYFLVALFCWLLWRVLGKIRRKDPTFLRDHYILAIMSLLIGLGPLVAGLETGDANWSTTIRMLGATLLVFVPLTLYYTKSERVRTYMGTDVFYL